MGFKLEEVGENIEKMFTSKNKLPLILIGGGVIAVFLLVRGRPQPPPQEQSGDIVLGDTKEPSAEGTGVGVRLQQMETTMREDFNDQLQGMSEGFTDQYQSINDRLTESNETLSKGILDLGESFSDYKTGMEGHLTEMQSSYTSELKQFNESIMGRFDDLESDRSQSYPQQQYQPPVRTGGTISLDPREWDGTFNNMGSNLKNNYSSGSSSEPQENYKEWGITPKPRGSYVGNDDQAGYREQMDSYLAGWNGSRNDIIQRAIQNEREGQSKDEAWQEYRRFDYQKNPDKYDLNKEEGTLTHSTKHHKEQADRWLFWKKKAEKEGDLERAKAYEKDIQEAVQKAGGNYTPSLDYKERLRLAD